MINQKRRKKRRPLIKLILVVLFLCAVTGALICSMTQPDFYDVSNEADWRLTLVNKWHEVPDNGAVKTINLSNGETVDARIYPAIQKMFDQARKEGVYPNVTSGYRTEEEQKRLYDKKISDYVDEGYSTNEAQKEAEKWVALPGTSEHQLGVAIDVNSNGTGSDNEEVYRWLERNAHRYGFILRYPSDKTELTNTYFEPWHYRYVGEKAAEEIFNRDICLEEYLDEVN